RGGRQGRDRRDCRQGTEQELRLSRAGARGRAEQDVSTQMRYAVPPSGGVGHKTAWRRHCDVHEDLPMKTTRRRFLRAAGVSLALPWLDALAAANDTPGAGAGRPRRRMVCTCTPLGLHPPSFFPEKAGKDYALTPYLELIKDFRGDFTVMS